MPATKSRSGPYETNLDQTNTARFLFGEDEPNLPNRHTPDHSFPTLVRRDDQMVSSIFLDGWLFEMMFKKVLMSIAVRQRDRVGQHSVCQLPASCPQLCRPAQITLPSLLFLTH